MTTFTAQVDDKYQVVLPEEVYDALGIQPCDMLIFLVDKDAALVRQKPASFTEALRGLHSHVWASSGQSADEWLERERSLWEA